MNWKNKAKRLLGNRTIHLQGDGQFALVTPCRTPTFSLWPTRAEAEQAKNRIMSCGGDCHGVSAHYCGSRRGGLIGSLRHHPIHCNSYEPINGS